MNYRIVYDEVLNTYYAQCENYKGWKYVKVKKDSVDILLSGKNQEEVKKKLDKYIEVRGRDSNKDIVVVWPIED
jgi:hypothetical protein